MSEDNQLVVAEVEGNFSMKMFDKVKGLTEDSPLKRMQSQATTRFTVVGNKFVIRNGKQEQILKGKDKRPVKYIDVVIHDFSPDIQRQLAVPYDSKNPVFTPLGCWSNNGNTPDEDVWGKQSEDCDTCPRGGNGDFSCTMSRNIVISLYSPDTVPEEPMIFTTNWSSNSTKKAGEDIEETTFGLINYLKFLAGKEVEPYKVVTRLYIDDWSENTPANNCKVLFQPRAVLSKGNEPNRIAHDKWTEDEDRLPKMIKIFQRQPDDEDAVVGDEAGASVEDVETEEPVKQSKKKASKKKASKKKAAKKVKEEVVDLEDLEDFDLDDESDEVDGELVEEDDMDFGDLGDLDDLLDE